MSDDARNSYSHESNSISFTMKNPELNKKHIVLVGGGFAGLNFLRRLCGHAQYHNITLLDKNNYNYFTPLLYQVATGFLEPSSISYPFRKLFRGSSVSFRMAIVSRVEAATNRVYLDDGTYLRYDFLVFAAGTQPNFFANESIRRNAIALKGIDDALAMRNALIRVFEQAAVEQNRIERQKLLTIVIAGGGPTGVEVAGMLAELKAHILHREYPEISVDEIKLYIIDGTSHLLEAMSPQTRQEAAQILTTLGINVIVDALVTRYENDEVRLSNGVVIETKTLIWAAGVTAMTFEGIEPSSLGRGGRMITDPFHRVKGYPNVFAIGDISIQQHELAYAQGHPQLAQPAIQQGKSLAKNFERLARGRVLVPFKYADRGEMAIIGRKHALVDLFKHTVHFGGLVGLLIWLFIHLISLVNYNNIVKTLYTWAVAYITRDQALRMIFKASLPIQSRESFMTATEKTTANGKVLTRDLGGTASTPKAGTSG